MTIIGPRGGRISGSDNATHAEVAHDDAPVARHHYVVGLEVRVLGTGRRDKSECAYKPSRRNFTHHDIASRKEGECASDLEGGTQELG